MAFKIIALGSQAVGKTSMIRSYLGYEFKEIYLQTINLDSFRKYISPSEGKLKKENVNLNIIDVSGNESFICMAKLMLRNASGLILVYSKTDRKSFEDIENIWIKSIEEYFELNKIPMVLVANKSDLPSEEEDVTKEEGKELSIKYNIPFYECSAKEKNNIEEVFNFLSKKIIDEYSEKNKDDKINTFKIEKKRQRKGRYIKNGCDPIFAFANFGQAFADAMYENQRRKKCLI